MITVYKYNIRYDDQFELAIPKDAKILTVQTQNNYPYIWALVDTDNALEYRLFRFAGTGHPIALQDGRTLKYIGTFQQNDGSFVGHLFEIQTAISEVV